MGRIRTAQAAPRVEPVDPWSIGRERYEQEVELRFGFGIGPLLDFLATDGGLVLAGDWNPLQAACEHQANHRCAMQFAVHIADDPLPECPRDCAAWSVVYRCAMTLMDSQGDRAASEETENAANVLERLARDYAAALGLEPEPRFAAFRKTPEAILFKRALQALSKKGREVARDMRRGSMAPLDMSPVLVLTHATRMLRAGRFTQAEIAELLDDTVAGARTRENRLSRVKDRLRGWDFENGVLRPTKPKAEGVR